MVLRAPRSPQASKEKMENWICSMISSTWCWLGRRHPVTLSIGAWSTWQSTRIARPNFMKQSKQHMEQQCQVRCMFAQVKASLDLTVYFLLLKVILKESSALMPRHSSLKSRGRATFFPCLCFTKQPEISSWHAPRPADSTRFQRTLKSFPSSVRPWRTMNTLATPKFSDLKGLSIRMEYLCQTQRYLM